MEEAQDPHYGEEIQVEPIYTAVKRPEWELLNWWPWGLASYTSWAATTGQKVKVSINLGVTSLSKGLTMTSLKVKD